MNAEIISIGDELLIGQVINTNQAYIAEQFNAVGIFVDTMTTVGDNEEHILQAFEKAWNNHNIVAVTGGLGPTHDDITRAAVCKFFNTELIVNEQALTLIKIFFERRGKTLTPLNIDQARVPKGCTVIQNTVGTAPGFFFQENNKYFIVMPGVPYEMKEMMHSFVVPFFAKNISGIVIRHRTLKTTGIPESFLAEKIGNTNSLFIPYSGISLAYLPSPLGVRLRISVKASTIEEAETKIFHVEQKIREKIHHYIYGVDFEELEEVVGKLLKSKHLTIAIAESCTGGLISHRLTNVPGSSEYFKQSFVTYSNHSKQTELNVPHELIDQYGAVSKEVALAMANGVRVVSNSDIGISVTGIAGPTGATPTKPIGLVWIGYSDKVESNAYKYIFNGDRTMVKEKSAQAALEILRRKLLGIEVE